MNMETPVPQGRLDQCTIFIYGPSYDPYTDEEVKSNLEKNCRLYQSSDNHLCRPEVLQRDIADP